MRLDMSTYRCISYDLLSTRTLIWTVDISRRRITYPAITPFIMIARVSALTTLCARPGLPTGPLRCYKHAQFSKWSITHITSPTSKTFAPYDTNWVLLCKLITLRLLRVFNAILCGVNFRVASGVTAMTLSIGLRLLCLIQPLTPRPLERRFEVTENPINPFAPCAVHSRKATSLLLKVYLVKNAMCMYYCKGPTTSRTCHFVHRSHAEWWSTRNQREESTPQ